MPKLKDNQVPSYRLHKQSGQAVVTLNGRDVLLGKHGSAASKAEYRRVSAEWLAAKGVPPPSAGADLTVSELILAFWRHAQDYYRKPDGTVTSEVAVYKLVLRVLRRVYGHTLAAEFGPRCLKAVVQEMIVLGWCRRSINTHAGRIKHVFKWAVENELVPPSVYHGLLAVSGLARGRTTARESEPVRPVPEAHIDAVLPLVSPQVRAMIQLQLVTGARPGEICAMRGRDLDTNGRLWTYRLESHKTLHHGHARVLYLGPRAQAITGYLPPHSTHAVSVSARRRSSPVKWTPTLSVSHTSLWPQASRAEALRRIEAGRKVQASLASRVAELSAAEPLVLQVSQLLQDAGSSREQRARAAKELEAIDIQRKRAESLSAQVNEGSQVIREVAVELGVGMGEGASGEPLPELTSRALQAAMTNVQQQAYERTQLLEVYREAMGCAQRLDSVRAQLVQLRAEATNIANARARVTQTISVAKAVTKAATEAKRTVLDRIFNERLNGLCIDLFKRLTVGEQFSPRLSEPATVRGQVRASVQAISEGTQPFDQLAAVLSAGNVNTAALSLFMSLHLIDEPAHRVLVLDDPVQSMDDVHVVHMATLLRSLAHQTRRQLVLAVHERALFDYLSSELGPTAEGQTLATIELTRDSKTYATSAQIHRREWEGSPDRFGRSLARPPA